ncbi:MAG: hypothetical protein AB7F67_03780, partial [Rhodospirillaceae bacterium]
MPFDGPHSAWPRRAAGIDPDGSNDYVSFTGPAIPATPWCLGFLYRCDSNTGSNLQYIVSVRNLPFGGSPNVTIYWGDSGSAVGSNWNWDYTDDNGVPIFGSDNFWSAPLPADGQTRLIVMGRDWRSNFTIRTMRPNGLYTEQATASLKTSLIGIAAGTWVVSGRSDLNGARFSRNPIGNFFFVRRYLSRGDMAALANGRSIRDVVPKSQVKVDLALSRPPTGTVLRHQDGSGSRFHGSVAASTNNAALTRSFRRHQAPPWVPVSVIGGDSVAGSGTATAGRPGAAATGAVDVSGAGAAKAAPSSASGAGNTEVAGGAAAIAGRPVVTAAGAVDTAGAGAAAAGAPGAAAAGIVEVQGTGAAAAGAAAAAAGGAVDVSAAAVAVSGAGSSSAGTGAADVAGTASPATDPGAGAGSGAVEAAGAAAAIAGGPAAES